MGKQTAKQLLQMENNSKSKNDEWHVICAVRDTEKMAVIAEEEDFPNGAYTIMKCDLASFDSVRDFVAELRTKFPQLRQPDGAGLDRLVCNAAVYQPSLDYARYTVDGHEQQMQTNFLSHFLLGSLLVIP